MKLSLRLLLIVAGLLLASQTGAPPAGAEPPPSVTLIEEAYRRGEIDHATALLYQAYTIVAPERLPSAFQSPTPAKDATPIIRELQAGWALLGPMAQVELAGLGFARTDGGAVVLARPWLSGEKRYDTTHFVVHYASSGADRPPSADVNPPNGIPDYVEDVGREMENVWTTELGTFGWLEPPPDGSGGGDSRYDVYLEDTGYYGYTADDGLAWDNPNSPGVVETKAAMSYVVLENDYQGFPNTPLENIQVTGAHEFNHAIQFGYDSWEPADWLWESVATWMEDEVYDDVNDNASYLSHYFNVPDVCLPAEGSYPYLHWYADWIFWRYVSEHHGGQVTVRRVWENAVFYDNFAAVGPALAAAGTDMATVFDRFAATNLLQATCPDDDPYCYREPELYPEPVRQHTIYYDAGSPVTYEPTDGVQTDYSTDYITISASGSIRVSVAGKSASTQYGAGLVGRRPGGAAVLPITLGGSPLSGSRVVDASTYTDLALVLTNLTESGSCGNRTYRVTVECGVLGDVSGDGQVTFGDITKIQGDWRNPDFDLDHDLDGDSAVTARDAQLAAREWGESCP